MTRLSQATAQSQWLKVDKVNDCMDNVVDGVAEPVYPPMDDVVEGVAEPERWACF